MGYFQDPELESWTRFGQWTTPIVVLDTGRVLGVDERDRNCVGDWLFARPLYWRLAGQVLKSSNSAAFHKALRTWLPRTTSLAITSTSSPQPTKPRPRSGKARTTSQKPPRQGHGPLVFIDTNSIRPATKSPSGVITHRGDLHGGAFASAWA